MRRELAAFSSCVRNMESFLPVAFSSSSPWSHQTKKYFNRLVNDGCRLDLQYTVQKSQRFVLKIIENAREAISNVRYALPCAPCTRKKFGSQSNYPLSILCCRYCSNRDVADYRRDDGFEAINYASTIFRDCITPRDDDSTTWPSVHTASFSPFFVVIVLGSRSFFF